MYMPTSHSIRLRIANEIHANPEIRSDRYNRLLKYFRQCNSSKMRFLKIRAPPNAFDVFCLIIPTHTNISHAILKFFSYSNRPYGENVF